MIAPDEQEPDSADLVRPYVITNGRGLPEDDQFSLITLVTAAVDHERRMARLDPEKRAVLELCSGGYLSVAEIAGHMRLPLGVVKILLVDLAEGGHLVSRAPAPRAQLVDRQLLQEVLDGLQARFG
ncbi:MULTISPECIES: DUF742 domain-containing protein [unclassified Streptomyces]|uniref:DUF742 domain-containing protein n=1 Tax=unclassified Streptomyces TaxID=2593676 RepID=UPI0022B664A8|nr:MULTISPECIES: DUF742 domain-containing protein [unclassified Streptomyces]MCZ7413829.1 DUF742 domain-containing protein [Streptomyces sp. WMMC897]MCZ7430825.1 DUF742 domain-containing protein [Streptomyces sp. WMMC1477]